MSNEWRNEVATEEQKEKLRFFGCTWDEGITAGQANDALEECAKQFPNAEADYQKSQPATEIQYEKLRFFGCTWDEGITAGQANDALAECASQFPDKEAIWQLQKEKWVKTLGTFPVKEFDQLGKVFSQEATIQKAETVVSQSAAAPARTVESPLQHLERTGRANPFDKTPSQEATVQKTLWCSMCRKSKIVEHSGQHWCPDCGRFVAPLDPEIVAQLNLRPQNINPREFAATDNAAPGTGRNCPGQNLAVNTDQDWRNAPATEKQKENLRTFDCKFDESITVGIAKLLIEHHKNLQTAAPIAPKESEADGCKSVMEWDKWVEERRNQSGETSSEEVTIQEAAKPQQANPREIIPKAPDNLGQFYEMYCPACNGQIQVLQGTVGKNQACPHCQSEIIPVFTRRSPKSNVIPAHEVQEYARQKAREIIKGNKSACATVEECSHDEYSTPKRPIVRKPTAYKITIPIERFSQWTDGFLERNRTCIGSHWLPVGPLKYVFASEAISIGLCRQMADTVESKGYCVEPDARFGSGTYDRNQTLALFKPLDGDPIQPSAAYLGAANLLRLCVLITTADGKIDLVELEVFRRAIENQPGLSLTDHKRLLILEQLLVQELCSASKTTAKIAKSVPADKRLVIGKLLVEVAAANNVITDGERRVLEKIFKSFEIPPDTLEKLVTQICPSRWPHHDSGASDVSKKDQWLWNNWRAGHPGIVIDDTTLDKKTWNFNDWKALNARWRDLHDRLVARQKNPNGACSASFPVVGGREQISKINSWKSGFCKCCEKENTLMSRSPSGEVRSYCVDCEGEIKRRVFDQRLNRWIIAGQILGTSSKKIPESVAAPASKEFTLDMTRVYEITRETKEVVAILSVMMEDEPEKSMPPLASITLPTPEVSKVSGNAAPQPTRFNGLDGAFHLILERLLARDSWSQNDFNSLAREFHFMPLNIRDTLNEWADEALGDFILDGEDPVVIHRELITKEKVYG